MDAKFTPGPWLVRRSLAGSDALHISSVGDNNIAAVKREANARLIAAAPELLAELQNIANAKRFDRDAFENDTAFVEWARSRAHAAIALATGAA